jgi:phosphoribosylaminoimidazolecarboxamide formyltransferase/IMP cyclohydrolase
MENGLIKIRKALISVYDKANIAIFAQQLKGFGCEIISTGGTKRELIKSGVDVTDISSVTGNPEAFSGRMKTISFKIESALLFDREKDKIEAQELSIEPIDLVVCNLYPFSKVLKEKADIETLIENIDIGGPTMIRAAAKNFKYVTVLTSPQDYSKVIEELQDNDGAVRYTLRKELMRKAFNHTADYDALIADAMDKENGVHSLRLGFSDGKELRYGENSHQKAMYYKENGYINSLYDMDVLHGKELSFNNIIDINGAIEAVNRLEKIGCSVVKHTNPCGLAEGDDQRKAFEMAWSGDPISAYGSIIAFNQPVVKDTVDFLELKSDDKIKRKFVEVVVAPKFSDDALEYLKQNKNLRIIEYDTESEIHGKDIRYMNGLLLVQDKDKELYSKMDIVTNVNMDVEKDIDLIAFGLKAISSIKSNSIVVVRKKDGYNQLLGMGAGQPNRVTSTKIALEKCSDNLMKEYTGDSEKVSNYIKEELGKAILVSDAFFPFPDNIMVADQYGIKKIIQPGGSIRDKTVIKACNEAGIAMAFTGIRHFKH